MIVEDSRPTASYLDTAKSGRLKPTIPTCHQATMDRLQQAERGQRRQQGAAGHTKTAEANPTPARTPRSIFVNADGHQTSNVIPESPSYQKRTQRTCLGTCGGRKSPRPKAARNRRTHTTPSDLSRCYVFRLSASAGRRERAEPTTPHHTA